MSNTQFNKVMKELIHFDTPYDPLIIYLNKNIFFYTEGRGISCNKLKEYDTNYFKERTFKSENNRYKYLVEIVKHIKVKLV